MIKRISVFLVIVLFVMNIVPGLRLDSLGFGVEGAYAEPLSYDVKTPHVIINQVYGAGDKDGYISHSFIELYNPANIAVDIGGWSVQYRSSEEGEDTTWKKLELTSSINAHSSYLVRCQEVNKKKSIKYTIDSCDQEWDQSLYNKGLSVVLLSNNNDITGSSVFNNTTKRPIISGYVDMISVGGNDKKEEQDPPCFETSFNRIQSKKNAVRRKSFSDSDDNATDTEAVDYSSDDMDDYLPRWSGDGVWGTENQISSSNSANDNGTDSQDKINTNGLGVLSINTVGGWNHLLPLSGTRQDAWVRGYLIIPM